MHMHLHLSYCIAVCSSFHKNQTNYVPTLTLTSSINIKKCGPCVDKCGWPFMSQHTQFKKKKKGSQNTYMDLLLSVLHRGPAGESVWGSFAGTFERIVVVVYLGSFLGPGGH